MPLQTISDLLDVIDRLPSQHRAPAIAQLDRILDLDAGVRELALGLLALDLAPHAQTMTVPDRQLVLV